jgi:hypothetical protein
MTMSIPNYSLVIIKHLSIGRGHGPFILSDILRKAPVSLRMFRHWKICDTSLKALCTNTRACDTYLSYNLESDSGMSLRPSWICLFTHLDRSSDPHPILDDVLGRYDGYHPRSAFGIRHNYCPTTNTVHNCDTVVHLTDPLRNEYEASILFKDFKEADI